jgi:hypothetical protein
MNTKRVFQQLAQKTHMPFYNDGTLVFCAGDRVVKHKFADHSAFGRRFNTGTRNEYRPWKLAVCDWTAKKIQPIKTGMPDDVVLCNPTFFQNNDGISVSFAAGKPHAQGMDYHLYQMKGESWVTLGKPQQIGEEYAQTGFINSRLYCLGGAGYLTILDQLKGERSRITTSLEEISRAIYDPNAPGKLLITGVDEWSEYCTLLFDIDTHEVLEIRGPAPGYKACLVGNRIVFSYKESNETEDYQLHIAPAEFTETAQTVVMERI